MSTSTLDLPPEGIELPGDESTESPVTLAVHRAFRVAVPLAALLVVVAIGVNWWMFARSADAIPPVLVPGGGGGAVPPPQAITLEKPALDMLPGNVLQYETIAHQSIPGMDDTGAEAIFKTLNMNTEARIAVVVYARAEGFNSDEDAQARIKDLMEPYTVEREETLLGETPVIAGYAANRGSYAFGWTRGRYMTLVKASFAEWIPEHSHDIAKDQAVWVAELVEFFQRTGKQGVRAR